MSSRRWARRAGAALRGQRCGGSMVPRVCTPQTSVVASRRSTPDATGPRMAQVHQKNPACTGVFGLSKNHLPRRSHTVPAVTGTVAETGSATVVSRSADSSPWHARLGVRMRPSDVPPRHRLRCAAPSWPVAPVAPPTACAICADFPFRNTVSPCLNWQCARFSFGAGPVTGPGGPGSDHCSPEAQV